ncbi:Mannose-6-phosphate isomerase [Bifidobacterium cuniculi]|uniref:mannose-6-phosphate isomerase n=1 Tax=Bifidobacterium cuniculi TaxID=1688 RepID=A0A087AWV8_9BIFI|nr:Mannose-6-phosphate isomerase [Bifidobacterium cuniculi]
MGRFAYNEPEWTGPSPPCRQRKETSVYTILPVPKQYAWGSNEHLQRLFHLPEVAREKPLAEMWYSGHPQSPSTVEIDGRAVPLTHAIGEDPDGMVGTRGVTQFGPQLPFLLKLICAQRPLSLQVHPVGFQARAGYNAENLRHVPLDAPERSFKDMNAKSEMVVALEPFQASVGFAGRSFALRNLEGLRSPVAQRMIRALQGNGAEGEFDAADRMLPVDAIVWPEHRKRVFRAFHTAVTAGCLDSGELRDDLLCSMRTADHERTRLACDFTLQAADAFPGDPSVLALLMMNPVQLEEGESVFLPTGVPHAYIHGMGAEIMTNSDNVLRAGMTVKYKDIPNLLHCVDCKPSSPVDPSDSRLAAFLAGDVVFYRPGVSEYVLAYGHVDAAHGPWPLVSRLARRYDRLVQQVTGHGYFPHRGPRVVVCTQGAVRCVSERDERILRQGDAVFVPASDGWAHVEPVAGGEAAPEGSYLMASTPF